MTLPAQGAPCTPIASCEYGYGADPRCTIVTYCAADVPVGDADATFLWHPGFPDPSCDANAAACPATFGAVANGAACPVSGTCTYPEGRCSCDPCAQPPTDGGAVDLGTPATGRQWACEAWKTPAGCPEPRPLLGSSCNNEGQECDYGDLCGPVDLAPSMSCTGGHWVQTGATGCDGLPPICGAQ